MTSIPHSALRQSLEIAVTVCLLASCVGQSTSPPASWQMYRGDLARDGHPPVATLDARAAKRLVRRWSVRLDGAVDGTPAVTKGIVVAGTAAGTLAAVDANDGHALWSTSRLGAISSSPAADGDRVYATTLTGRVYAFGLSRGNPMWSWTAPHDSALWSSPVAYRGEVIVGVASPYGDQPLVAGRLIALDSANGSVRWTMCLLPACAPGDGIWSTPAIDAGGTAFVGVGNPEDGVLAFDAMTGMRKWLKNLYADHDRDLDVGASPVVFALGGREVIGQATVEGMFAVLDARSGDLLWSRELVAGSAVHGLLASPAYDGTALFAASAGDPTGMFALDPHDGSIRWRRPTRLPVYSAPVVGSGVVAFGSGNVFGDVSSGSIFALATADGSVLWSYDTHSAVRSGPALVGDVLVVGDHAGDLVTFQPKG
jgi:outer membrane protein assembly factor BamB